MNETAEQCVFFLVIMIVLFDLSVDMGVSGKQYWYRVILLEYRKKQILIEFLNNVPFNYGTPGLPSILDVKLSSNIPSKVNAEEIN